MFRPDHRGMATAEFTTGTLGTAIIATVLIKLGLLDDHNPWVGAFRDMLEQALSWHTFSDLVNDFTYNGPRFP